MRAVACLGPYRDDFLPLLRHALTGLPVELVEDAARVGADVVVTVPLDTPELRAAAAGAPWLHCLSTGIDGFPLDLAGGRVVTCSRGASAVPIAEYVLAALLDRAKGLAAAAVSSPPTAPVVPVAGTLAGTTLGLLGLGAIGTEVARRAAAFDVRIVAHRRRRDFPAPPGVEVAGRLEAVLEQADHLVVAVPVTPATRHLLGAAAFAGLRPGAHLVNVSRGAVVDTCALVAALDDGTVGFATLDVTDPEPLPAGHPLYRHPRVRITPHVAWAGPAGLGRVVGGFAENVRRHEAGEALLGVVDAAAGY